MSIKYICPHCRIGIGQLDSSVSEFQLGFHFLTTEERRDIISYDSNGDVTVRIACDYCREAVENNPELSLIVNPLQ